jgi:hypothetical protein
MQPIQPSDAKKDRILICVAIAATFAVFILAACVVMMRYSYLVRFVSAC